VYIYICDPTACVHIYLCVYSGEITDLHFIIAGVYVYIHIHYYRTHVYMCIYLFVQTCTLLPLSCIYAVYLYAHIHIHYYCTHVYMHAYLCVHIYILLPHSCIYACVFMCNSRDITALQYISLLLHCKNTYGVLPHECIYTSISMNVLGQCIYTYVRLYYICVFYSAAITQDCTVDYRTYVYIHTYI